MAWTTFSRLRTAAQLLGASQAIAQLDKKIRSGREDVSPEDVIAGEEGIYVVGRDGVLTRIIVTIVDKNVSGRFFGARPNALLDAGKFEEHDLVDRLHRFHFVKCATIEQAEADGWSEKYKKNISSDGFFYYRFLSDNDVVAERDRQRLYACGNCLKQIQKRAGIAIGQTREAFVPKMFFELAEGNNLVNLESHGGEACTSVPNKYAADWAKISRFYKQKVDYQCEAPNCMQRDLSDPSVRKFLHVHHINMEKSNNHYSNLRALCIACHAEQPGHNHMKALPEYRTYVSRRSVRGHS